MRTGVLLVSMALGVAAGCAGRAPAIEPAPSRVGTSQLEDFQRPATSSIAVGEKPAPMIVPPVAVERALPRYPESALADEITCVARLLYHVEVSGHATLVRIGWDTAPPPEHLAAFEAALADAVSGWIFTPGQRIVPDMRPVPQAQNTLVRFRVERGRPVVEVP